MGDADKVRRLAGPAGRLTGGNQLEIDVKLQFLALLVGQGAGKRGAGIETELANWVHRFGYLDIVRSRPESGGNRGQILKVAGIDWGYQGKNRARQGRSQGPLAP